MIYLEDIVLVENAQLQQKSLRQKITQFPYYYTER